MVTPCLWARAARTDSAGFDEKVFEGGEASSAAFDDAKPLEAASTAFDGCDALCPPVEDEPSEP